MTRNKILIILLICGVSGTGAWWMLTKKKSPIAPEQLSTSLVAPVKAPLEYRFGIAVTEYDIVEKKIQSGQSLSTILGAYHVGGELVQELVDQSADVFDVTRFRVGKPYTLFCSKEGNHEAKCMVYEPSPAYYIVFDLRRQPDVYKVEKKVDTIEKSVGGVITSSLYQAVEDQGLDVSIASQLYDIYKWSVDFFALQKGDEFKLIVDEDHVDSVVVNVGEIKAAYFKTNGKEFYAFRYTWEGHTGFYGADGMSLKSRFLQAPLDFTRISSGFNMNRYHPILKKVKPHLGTDYAAPKGTPIVSVADGVVLEASFTSGNGNYVKIKHDDTYTTQYLHMSKFEKGIKKGVRVNQGDVIGYVGSTGLATGPHLCYRFWKNGKQVDPFKEQPQATEPLPESQKAGFNILMNRLKPKLDAIATTTAPGKSL
jgi:murein DD-endopeptidase MepM/ murein hydrolase activator NlpD